MTCLKQTLTFCFFVFAGSALSMGCGAHKVGGASKAGPAEYRYEATLGPSDIFEVKVFQEADLSGKYRVSSDGMISFPLIGGVKVAGKMPSEVAREIETRLKDYLKNPQVSIFVEQYNSQKIFILGQVKSPGTLQYVDNMSIIQAITQAGGFTQTASQNSVSVTRNVSGQATKIVVQVDKISAGKVPNFLLQPGDIVEVPESFF